MRFFLLLSLAAVASPALAQGGLAFDAERHDFGAIAEGDTAVHVFAFTNTGDTAVTLEEVHASCGCTTPSFTTDPVAPGARGEITVAYDSQGRPGPFGKTVAVMASDAEPSHVLLRIAGHVVPDFVADGVRQGSLVFATDAWDGGSLASGDLLQHAFRFQHVGERPLRILAVRSGDGIEVFAPERPLFPGDVYSVVVSVERPAEIASALGEVDVAVVIVTDDPEQPTKALRMTARLAISEQ